MALKLLNRNSIRGLEAKFVLLYDGVCNLCDSTVQFVIKRDKHKIIRYAGLQSTIAIQLLAKRGVDYDPQKPHSIFYISNDSVYAKSGAILRVCKRLKGAWPLMSVFLIVPRFIRDFVYDFIARNRYKWFGTKDYCEIPSGFDKALFLDINETK